MPALCPADDGRRQRSSGHRVFIKFVMILPDYDPHLGDAGMSKE